MRASSQEEERAGVGVCRIDWIWGGGALETPVMPGEETLRLGWAGLASFGWSCGWGFFAGFAWVGCTEVDWDRVVCGELEMGGSGFCSGVEDLGVTFCHGDSGRPVFGLSTALSFMSGSMTGCA